MFVPQILYMKYLVYIWFHSTNWLLNPKVEYDWHFIPRNLAKQRNGMSIAIPVLFIPFQSPFHSCSIPFLPTKRTLNVFLGVSKTGPNRSFELISTEPKLDGRF